MYEYQTVIRQSCRGKRKRRRKDEKRIFSSLFRPGKTPDLYRRGRRPGGIIDGKEIEMQVKVGDKVLCSKYAGSDFKVDGKEFTIIKQSDILAVVED